MAKQEDKLRKCEERSQKQNYFVFLRRNANGKSNYEQLFKFTGHLENVKNRGPLLVPCVGKNERLANAQAYCL